MDPKHQFAAQYVLSRAAAERREREILASSSLGIISDRREFSMLMCSKREGRRDAKTSVQRRQAPICILTRRPCTCTGAGLGVLGGSQSGGPQNLQQPPMCPSPSAHSDSSSGNGRLSSAGSEPGTLRYLFYVYHLQTIAHQVSRYNRYNVVAEVFCSTTVCNLAVIRLFFPDFVNDKTLLCEVPFSVNLL